jgi:hypothetical protein
VFQDPAFRASRCFLAEFYVPRSAVTQPWDSVRNAVRAAAELRRTGQQIWCLGAVHAIEDETCFVLFEADSMEVVAALARISGRRFDKIGEASRMHSPDRYQGQVIRSSP